MDMQVCLAARANLYTAFQRLLGGKPTQGLLDVLDAELLKASAEVLAEAAGADDAETPGFAFLDRDWDFDGLDSGYFKLFEGPGSPKAKPWESLHLSRQPRLFNEVTLSVRRFYKALDVTVTAGHGVADDHVALELGFLRELAGRAQAACAEDAKAATDLLPGGITALAASAQFLDEHLLKWVDKFDESVAEAEPKLASQGFYTACTRALTEFLQIDHAWLTASLPAIDPDTGKPVEA